MRYLNLTVLIVLATSNAMLAEVQIPDKALCSVCVLKGGETEQEKVKAHSYYDGKAYYFCSENCKIEFHYDPVAYLLPVLPRPAPASVVEMLEGGKLALRNLQGSVVLVDFWATWCKPCLKAMPRLQKLYSAHSDKGLQVLGVSIDEDQDRIKKIKTMVGKMEISYPIFIDTQRTPAWHQFKVKAIPAMYLLDRENQIVAQWSGKIDYEEVEPEVLRWLEKKVEVGRP